jgi:hypothetical protein
MWLHGGKLMFEHGHAAQTIGLILMRRQHASDGLA